MVSVVAKDGRLELEPVPVELIGASASSASTSHPRRTPTSEASKNHVQISNDVPATHPALLLHTAETADMRPILLSGHERALTQVKYNSDGDIIFTVSKDHVIVGCPAQRSSGYILTFYRARGVSLST